MKRSITAAILAFSMMSSGILLPWQSEAEARPQLAQRELKQSKSRGEDPSAYEKAHHVIYGTDAPSETSNRIRIAVIVNGDERLIVEDRVKNEIYSQLRKKFPREDFAVMKGTDVNTVLLQRAEDMYYHGRPMVKTTETRKGTRDMSTEATGIVSSVLSGVGDFLGGSRSRKSAETTVQVEKEDQVDVDGLPVDMQPRGLADIKREDLAWAGAKCGYDYVFLISLTPGRAKDEKHNFVVINSVTNHQNVWMRMRFVDVSSGNYLYRNDIAMKGKTHNGSIGRTYQRAVGKAMTEAMDDIDIVN